MEKKILLVEDDESLNRAISLKLQKEGYMVYRAASVTEAESLNVQYKAGLVICDIDLPDGSGLAFCQKLRKHSDVMFLFVTAMDSETDIMNGYAAGADDYITKPFYLSALLSKVNAIMKRFSKEEGPEALVSGPITFFPERGRFQKDGEYLNLTAKEQQLLSFFFLNPMRILSREQLLESIWDIDGNFVDENTLAVNIRRLREKIEDDPSSPVFLKNVRGLGYIWEKDVKNIGGEA